MAPRRLDMIETERLAVQDLRSWVSQLRSNGGRPRGFLQDHFLLMLWPAQLHRRYIAPACLTSNFVHKSQNLQYLLQLTAQSCILWHRFTMLQTSALELLKLVLHTSLTGKSFLFHDLCNAKIDARRVLFLIECLVLKFTIAQPKAKRWRVNWG